MKKWLKNGGKNVNTWKYNFKYSSYGRVGAPSQVRNTFKYNLGTALQQYRREILSIPRNCKFLLHKQQYGLGPNGKYGKIMNSNKGRALWTNNRTKGR